MRLTGCERVKMQRLDRLRWISFLKGFFDCSFESKNCQGYNNNLTSNKFSPGGWRNGVE